MFLKFDKKTKLPNAAFMVIFCYNIENSSTIEATLGRTINLSRFEMETHLLKHWIVIGANSWKNCCLKVLVT